MAEKYVSAQLLNELPRALINFLWYLWEVYCDPDIEESLFTLRKVNSGQRVMIPQINATFKQDFDTAVDAEIVIRKEGSNYYMSRQ